MWKQHLCKNVACFGKMYCVFWQFALFWGGGGDYDIFENFHSWLVIFQKKIQQICLSKTIVFFCALGDFKFRLKTCH